MFGAAYKKEKLLRKLGEFNGKSFHYFASHDILDIIKKKVHIDIYDHLCPEGKIY